jgi:hypothetical protein
MRQPITAKEAKKLTSETFDKVAPAHFALFMRVTSRLIENAACKGFYYIEVPSHHFHEPYTNYCVSGLQKMGYDVDFEKTETHKIVTISWKK